MCPRDRCCSPSDEKDVCSVFWRLLSLPFQVEAAVDDIQEILRASNEGHYRYSNQAIPSSHRALYPVMFDSKAASGFEQIARAAQVLSKVFRTRRDLFKIGQDGGLVAASPVAEDVYDLLRARFTSLQDYFVGGGFHPAVELLWRVYAKHPLLRRAIGERDVAWRHSLNVPDVEMASQLNRFVRSLVAASKAERYKKIVRTRKNLHAKRCASINRALILACSSSIHLSFRSFAFSIPRSMELPSKLKVDAHSLSETLSDMFEKVYRAHGVALVVRCSSKANTLCFDALAVLTGVSQRSDQEMVRQLFGLWQTYTKSLGCTADVDAFAPLDMAYRSSMHGALNKIGLVEQLRRFTTYYGMSDWLVFVPQLQEVAVKTYNLSIRRISCFQRDF